MKEWVIILVVLLLVFVPSHFIKLYLYKSGNEMIDIADDLFNNLEKNIVNSEYSNALKDEFLKKEKIWILLVDHDMLDEIEYEIEECVAMYSLETKNEFRSAYNRLKDEIEDLALREQVSWANIL